MIFGAWIHTHDDLPLEQQVALAAQSGIRSLRSYSVAYSERIAPLAQANGMSLFAGIHVNAGHLLEDWRSQFLPDQLDRCCQLEVPLAAICIGNELREGGDAPDQKRFSPRLADGLARVLRASREHLEQKGCPAPLTYAMEEIVYDKDLNFNEWVWPVIEACDVVSINAYPMRAKDWFTFGAFDESRRFLTDAGVRAQRLDAWEERLRGVLKQLKDAGKPVILSETGFPSAVGYEMDVEKHLVIPQIDPDAFAHAMAEFLARLRRVNRDSGEVIRAVYFYEWRDNLYHAKIWNIENSPIHTAFGLCDRSGAPKFDIRALLDE